MSGSPLGSVEVEPSNVTASGTAPLAGVAVARAVGASFGEPKLIRLTVPPLRSG